MENVMARDVGWIWMSPTLSLGIRSSDIGIRRIVADGSFRKRNVTQAALVHKAAKGVLETESRTGTRLVSPGRRPEFFFLTSRYTGPETQI